MPHEQLHSLTIDVEDWFHVCTRDPRPPIPREDWRVCQATGRILALLEEKRIKATFFMLGCVAEAEPELAGLIVSQGHEIASHGWSHRLLHELTSEQFEEELERTEDMLLRQTGKRPRGFRAPRWSLSARTPWAYGILAGRGYHYSSSVNPLPFLAGSRAYRRPQQVSTPQGILWELPPMVTSLGIINLPSGGGWGLRLFPPGMIVRTVASYQHRRQPAILYLHPREVDSDSPRLALSPLHNFAAYGTRCDASPRISGLLERFRFTTLSDLVDSWQSAY